MSNHLKAGELYAFATNEGACLVGKLLRLEGHELDLFIYDRTFPPLTPKAEIMEVLTVNPSPHNTTGYRISLTRRHFALMYPLWLGQDELHERDFLSNRQTRITADGRPVRFVRSGPYLDPVILFAQFWILSYGMNVLWNADPDIMQVLLASFGSATICALLLGAPLVIASVAFRWIEGLRTGLSIKKNPTCEFSLPLSLDEAFTKCRDTLGISTNRDFDYVDRLSGYIQGRVDNQNLVRIMCYQIDTQETGVIVSCYDLKGGTLGSDLWTLKKLVASITGSPHSGTGPLLATVAVRRFCWFMLTAVSACFSAMFLKVAILGAHEFLPILLLTTVLTITGFYLFTKASEAPQKNS